MQKILIVEDEPAIAEAVAYALQTDGFETQWCGTGGEAREALSSGQFSLIILDNGLPDCVGFDLCREIRRRSEIPVIFLTARASEIDRVVGLEIGGDDYVVKPFSPRELAARVKAVLRRGGTVAAPGAGATTGVGATVVRDIAIDHNRKRITYRGTPLELPRYEYRILEVLAGRPGWVFSRDKLMELVWEDPLASMDRTVDAHIKMIRAKMHEVSPGEDPIRTHRGVGYSLKDGQ